ncbi:MAG: hypothetical protein K6U87_10280 [Firmicutes bacterium]|nr:hypothetical protein [Bacillota bacterium]
MAHIIQLGVQTYFSPDDDTQGVFLDFLRQAQHEIRIAIYAWHLPPAVEILAAKVRAGVDVALVMDHSQATGHYEAPEVTQLVQAGCRVAIGTSQKHAILHHKFAVVDRLHVLAGSWNMSGAASREANYLQVVTNQDLASLFLAKWQELDTWIRRHEPQWQPSGPAPPG